MRAELAIPSCGPQ